MTARERMLALSALPSGSSARLHFLSIVQEAPPPDVIVGANLVSEIELELTSNAGIALSATIE